MFIAKPRRSALLLTVTCSVLAIAALLGTQHRMRMAIGVWRLVTDSQKLAFDPAKSVHPWRFAVDSTPVEPRTLEQAIALVIPLARTASSPEEAPHAMLDDPDSSLRAMRDGHNLHCYNVDLATTELLGNNGIFARMWDIDGHDGLGGNGHNLLEIWDASRTQWVAFDPYYRCYFTRDSSSSPLAFSDVRLLAIEQPGALNVHHFIPENPVRGSAEIIAEYQELSPLASVHTVNDFRWRYDHRYGILQPIAPLLDKLPLRPARAFRTLVIGGADQRFVISDPHTPHHEFRLVSVAFRALLIYAILMLIVDLFFGLRETRAARQRRRRARVAADVWKSR
jgi:hypothetical protein